MDEEKKRKMSYTSIINDSETSLQQKKKLVTYLLSNIVGKDCPTDALSLIMIRNNKLCKQQHELIIDISRSLMDEDICKNIAQMDSAQLVQLLLDCKVIIVTLKLFSVHTQNYSVFREHIEDSKDRNVKEALFVEQRIGCLNVVRSICSKSSCIPFGHLLCRSQLLESNIFDLLNRCIESDPYQMVSCYALIVLDDLAEIFGNSNWYDLCTHYNLNTFTRLLYKDTLTSRMMTWTNGKNRKNCGSCGSFFSLAPPCSNCAAGETLSYSKSVAVYAFFSCANFLCKFISNCTNKKKLRALTTDDLAIKGLIMWARIVPITTEDTERVKSIICLLSCLISHFEPVVEILLSKHDFLAIIERGVLSPDLRISTAHLSCLVGMAKRNVNTRNKISNSLIITKAVLRGCCSLNQKLQDIAVMVLHSLIDRSTAIRIIKAGFSEHDIEHMIGLTKVRSPEIAALIMSLKLRIGRYAANALKENSRNKKDDLSPEKVLQLKEEGNKLFNGSKYRAAIELYTACIDGYPAPVTAFRYECKTNCPGPHETQCVRSLKVTRTYSSQLEKHVLAALYSNRAQCYINLENYASAVSDCVDAIFRCDIGTPEGKKLHLKSVLRRATAYFELEKWTESLTDISYCLQMDECNGVYNEQYEKIFGKFRKMVGYDHLVKRCIVCQEGEGQKLKVCANCDEKYCSRVCQMNAWEDGHKENCRKKTLAV